MKYRILALVLCAAPIAAIAQQNFDTVKIRPFPLAENLYMLTGAGGNVGLLTGAEGIVMIDDQYAPLSEKLKTAIQSIDPGAIRFVINTHLHGDHSGGNENFKKLGATLMAHSNVRARMQKESVNRAGQTQPLRNKDAWPMVTFDSKLNVYLNGQDIELVHLEPGHTDGDIVVHFQTANIMHTGDSFVRTGYPFIDKNSGGAFEGYIRNLETIYNAANDQTKIIPGHGKLANRSDVKVFHDKLVDIRDQVNAALKKKTKVEDIPGLGITDKYEAELGKGFTKGKDFVLIVATELALAKAKK
jgi:glyoxylase-like metal-dependent hydrolase (beta-lactamase superfamily II)